MKKFSLGLIAIGALVMLGFLFQQLLSDSDSPLGFRIGVLVVSIGCLILLIAVGREQYHDWKGEDDDFKEVKY